MASGRHTASDIEERSARRAGLFSFFGEQNARHLRVANPKPGRSS